MYLADDTIKTLQPGSGYAYGVNENGTWGVVPTSMWNKIKAVVSPPPQLKQTSSSPPLATYALVGTVLTVALLPVIIGGIIGYNVASEKKKTGALIGATVAWMLMGRN